MHELRTIVFVMLLAGVAVAGIACGSSNTAAPVGDASDAATAHISLQIEGMT